MAISSERLSNHEPPAGYESSTLTTRSQLQNPPIFRMFRGRLFLYVYYRIAVAVLRVIEEKKDFTNDTRRQNYGITKSFSCFDVFLTLCVIKKLLKTNLHDFCGFLYLSCCCFELSGFLIARHLLIVIVLHVKSRFFLSICLLVIYLLQNKIPLNTIASFCLYKSNE